MKPETPYSRLLMAVRDFDVRVRNPDRRVMFIYPKNKLSEGWSVAELYERTHAANALGWSVVLRANDEKGLVVEYVKRPEDIKYCIW